MNHKYVLCVLALAWTCSAHASQESDAPVKSAADKEVGQRRDAEAECDRLWKIYRESQACFARYRTLHGISVEAFEHCTEVRDPSPECGPQKSEDGK